ncbi:MAG: tetratricopeptide repeat protein [Bacteroidetes bacterium]|uniref:Tetratricopeptide repeat protein n=1 Tax=Candidatus Cryptobacteroides faecipullorum TaxID=2840764 RepID=A0A9D9I9J3_9BACT|nr:tetratricopeptide repeat protein [Candidatus Cryptobacteroides faecipullorum]
MTEKNSNNEPRSASEWYDLGCIYRKNGEFGEAVNAFRAAVEEAESQMKLLGDEDADLLERLVSVREKAEASVGLILRITGFVNKDLMNP